MSMITNIKNVRKNKGFTLVELSITLVIVAFLVGSAISGFAVFRENSLIRQAQDDLELIHDALIGFAIQNGRLPCPDTDPAGSATSGMENRNGPAGAQTCNQAIGFLPHRDLGVAGINIDPWGLPYAYAVDVDFADDGEQPMPSACTPSVVGVSFGSCELGDIEVHDIGGVASGTANCNGVGPPVCNLLARNIPAIFYSFGANGFTAGSIHEQENLASWGGGPATDPTNIVYASRVYANSGADQFDDQIMWVSSAVLVINMVKAGRLP